MAKITRYIFEKTLELPCTSTLPPPKYLLSAKNIYTGMDADNKFLLRWASIFFSGTFFYFNRHTCDFYPIYFVLYYLFSFRSQESSPRSRASVGCGLLVSHSGKHPEESDCSFDVIVRMNACTWELVPLSESLFVIRFNHQYGSVICTSHIHIRACFGECVLDV